MALNFPDFVGDGGFDWKRVGEGILTDDPPDWEADRYNPYDDRWNMQYKGYTKDFTSATTFIKRDFTASDISNLNQSDLKRRLRKGLYLIDIKACVAPENLVQTVTSGQFYNYGAEVGLVIPHSTLMKRDGTPVNMTPMASDDRFCENIVTTYLPANTSFNHPGVSIHNRFLAFIDPQYIGSDPYIHVTYSPISSLSSGTYRARFNLFNMAFLLLYHMDYSEQVGKFEYQFWKED